MAQEKVYSAHRMVYFASRPEHNRKAVKGTDAFNFQAAAKKLDGASVTSGPESLPRCGQT